MRKILTLMMVVSAIGMKAAIVPPLDANFAQQDPLDGYTVIDANNDGVTWGEGPTGVTIKYNMMMPNDDWLITPGLQLEAGKVYDLSYIAHSAGTKYTETFEIRYGTAPTAAAMEKELLAPTEINMKSIKRQAHFTPETDGVYYIGFHAMSPRDQLGMIIEEIHLSAGLEGRVPEGVSELTVVADPSGQKNVDISFKTPTATFNGAALQNISSISIYRQKVANTIDMSMDGPVELIHKIESASPGQDIAWRHAADQCGEYVYSVEVANSYGNSPRIEARFVYVGYARPDAPTDGVCYETDNEGEVFLSWNAPLKDINERPLTADALTYKVIQDISSKGKFNSRTVVADGTSETSLKCVVARAGEPQAQVRYEITAYTEGGKSSTFTTLYVPAGTPYDAPLKESVASGLTSYDWGADAWVGNNVFYPQFDTTYDDIKSVDNDGGFFMFLGDDYWDTAYLSSGKIDLSNLVRPRLSFYALVVPNNHNTLRVHVDAGEGFDRVEEFLLDCDGLEGKDGGWKRFEVSLEPYKGKVVRIRFVGVVNSISYVALDDIEVYNLSDNDLAVSAIAVPASIKGGESGVATVTLENRGMKEASNYALNLYRNDKLVESVTSGLPAIAPKQTIAKEFVLNVAPVENGPIELRAEVIYDGDENMYDNVRSATIEICAPLMPAPENLRGDMSADGRITLTWSEPDRSGEPVVTHESFEDYDNFIIDNIGQWSVIDADGAKSCGWGDYTNHIPHLYTESFAYMVMDQRELDSESSLFGYFTAQEGDKYLISANNFGREIDKDDWLISPLLNGAAQKVRFIARGQFSFRTETGENFEQFEILVSKTGKEIDDFEKIAFHELVPKTWTEYEFEVPAGTQYFAIRATSHDAFWLMLDDFSFISLDGDPSKLELIGYNVYDNAVKLNDDVVKGTAWTLLPVADGVHNLSVSAVYRQCESGGSNVVTLQTSGIAEVIDSADVIVKAEGTDIVVTGATGQPIIISSLNGCVMYKSVSQGYNRFNVESGVYIVNVGGKVAKVVI